MDDIVKAAMAKWPHVPDCYGWLGLDARGRWWMRDERAQAAGPFAGAGANAVSRGAELRHDKLIAFIGRNYAVDAQGRWFFQNGPQRVYVELELTPWVWRLAPDGAVYSHTGAALAQVSDVLLDEVGRLYLVGDLGVGVVHTQDMHLAAQAVESGRWLPQPCLAAELPVRYGFVLSPAAARRASASNASK
ncbi:DUF2946 family protein [Tepidimonas charontis]|uniref:DUF2946 domain-containing protein n=1 Tax=Tepidimonas charontis TaxID=2267262 RepID=A0A554X3Y3_9BURK|nr:DUF2946 family protein [Tepidimonas charontis]TSE30466.1 hypothetical protein Tchar_02433 [Tepidimonas charontis]